MRRKTVLTTALAIPAGMAGLAVASVAATGLAAARSTSGSAAGGNTENTAADNSGSTDSAGDTAASSTKSPANTAGGNTGSAGDARSTANTAADDAGTAATGNSATGNARDAGSGGGSWPRVINLPEGWRPEGIAIRGAAFYVGSLANGAIYRGSVVTGRGEVLVAGREDGKAVGLEIDGHGRIWSCGGETGGASVYNSVTGVRLAEYAFGGGFVNDAVATRDAVYFTDSKSPDLYVVPLGARGALPNQAAVRTIELTGDLGEAGAFNNGIETTPNGKLIIVQSAAGRLVTLDPDTGASARVDLGGASVGNGDGLLRRGRILYVVRNRSNVIAQYRLNGAASTAELRHEITDPAFDVPTTIAPFGRYLYAVNARFGTKPTPDTTYTVVRVRG